MKVYTVTPFVVMAAAAFVVSVTAGIFKAWGPRIVINETRSEPQGFYRVIAHPTGEYRRGMVVVFPVPAAVQPLVYGRSWMRKGMPFLKELKGLEGDTVCIFPDRLEINHRRIGPVFRSDSMGQPLPQLRGCFAVPAGSFFAASEYFDKSFDGRYFGALPLNILEGEARPLWTF